MKPQYCAIIGDINKSRQLKNRAAVQNRFERAVAQINKEYRKEIASKFIITTGDEFQGLLSTPTNSYRFVRHFQELMEPIPFAFGIGIGFLATKLNLRSSIGMDGDCFYRARAALLRAKKEHRELFYDFQHPASALVNALSIFLEKQWSLLSETQKKILQMRKEKKTQQTIAKTLHISQRAVSKAIRTATIEEMEHSVIALNQFLKQYVANI